MEGDFFICINCGLSHRMPCKVMKKENLMVLIDVTRQTINEYNDKFIQDSDYHRSDASIEALILAFPDNESAKGILLKVAVINALYSTNVFDLLGMAAHIRNLGIDDRLRIGDPALVAEIAIPPKGKRRFYSFATKYCSWHNRKDYPIYDSFTSYVLTQYNQRDKFFPLGKPDLRNYTVYKSFIGAFRDYYHLEEFDFKQLDKFLWQYGKEIKTV